MLVVTSGKGLVMKMLVQREGERESVCVCVCVCGWVNKTGRRLSTSDERIRKTL